MTAAANPLYHRLISEFFRATGVAMVLNTSFNLRGEPIVHTPGHALGDYLKTGMDTVGIGDLVAEKVPPQAPAAPAWETATATGQDAGG